MAEEEKTNNQGEEEDKELEDQKGGITDQVRELLLRGMPRKQLLKLGYNKNTVRQVYSVLKNTGKLPAQRVKKEKEDEQAVKDKGEKKDAPSGQYVMAPGDRPNGNIETYPKGSPPEAIINALNLPALVGEEFESGLKVGMGLVVLGVRVVQELAQVGIHQARPLIELSKEMRKGEAEAAQTAAAAAASMAADEIGGTLAPEIMALRETVSKLSMQTSDDPMRGMMIRMMEPVLKNVVGKLIPGMPTDTTPSGWKRTQVP